MQNKNYKSTPFTIGDNKNENRLLLFYEWALKPWRIIFSTFFTLYTIVYFIPSVGQNFITNGFSKVKYQPLRAERKTKSRPFNSKTLPEQLLNSLKIIFRKSKNGFLTSKMGKTTLAGDQNMTKKIDF